MPARHSLPSDRESITELLRQTLCIPETAAALRADFQYWKYWGPHPRVSESRSRVVDKNGQLTAHLGLWPVRLRTAGEGTISAFHPIDWGAKRDPPGTGINLLRSSCVGFDAAIAIGGSGMTQKILPALGFKAYNNVVWFERPLHPWKPAWGDSSRDWKMPVRVARNWWQHSSPRLSLPAGWSFTPRRPQDLPQGLWPTARDEDEAVSVRSPETIEHFERCPIFLKTTFCALQKHSVDVAYFFLVQVGDQIRLADYGPAKLDAGTALAIGIAAQIAARTLFREATSLLAITSEPEVVAGWKTSGLRWQHEEPIKVLQTNGARNAARYRLTMLDWDVACL